MCAFLRYDSSPPVIIPLTICIVFCFALVWCGASVKWVPVVLGLGGIAIESIADAQKSRFRYILMQHSIVLCSIV